MAGALRLLSTHPTHTGVFSEAMPLSESVAFHRKESDETPRPNQQTALASAIYTRVLQNREGRPPRAGPCIRHLYPRTHGFSATFRTGFEHFQAKTFSYHSQLFIFAKEEKSGTRKQQPPPHLFNRRNETVFRQNTGKAHRPTSPKWHDADIVKAQSPGEQAKAARSNGRKPKLNEPKLQSRMEQSSSRTSQSSKTERKKAQAK
ncbi:hypothetical protein ABLT32_03590 [Bacteroides pyogenes]|uniref:hypothetical protein n=1 Tax=Bacteroides pyogenes TaxID=310300 RepID=UPI004062D041